MKKFMLEDIYYTHLDSVVRIEEAKLDKTFGEHKHVDFFEVVLIIKGTSSHIINDKKYDIKAGDFFVLGGNSSHAFISPNQLELINVMYHKDLIMKKLPFLFESQRAKAVFFLHPMIQEDKDYLSIFHLTQLEVLHLKKILYSSIESNENQLQAFVEMVLYLSRQLKSQISTNKQKEYVNAFASVVDYIDKNFVKQLSLDDLVDTTFFSKRTLARMFDKYFGTTPYSYILDKRLELAKSYLMNTDMSITQIAYSCGFNDSNYFSRLFKKRYKKTPRSLKKGKV